MKINFKILSYVLISILTITVYAFFRKYDAKMSQYDPNFDISIHANDLRINLRNNSKNCYYVISSFHFALNDKSEGFIKKFKTSPHGMFTAHEITSMGDLDLIINIQSLEGSFMCEATGQEVFPAKDDVLYLIVTCKIASFETCQAYTLTKSVIIKRQLVNKYFESEDLTSKKSENRGLGIESLQPLESHKSMLPDS